MSDPNQPHSFDKLGDRIAKARKSSGLAPDTVDADVVGGQGLGAAWRISIEIVVAVVVCTAVGYGLDRFFETTPWFMLLFLFLGGAAGINNAVRTALRMDAEASRALTGDKSVKTDQPGESSGKAGN